MLKTGTHSPMLSLEGCLNRRNRLWKAVPDEMEWLLIADPRHVHYLANFWIQPLSFSAGERGLLLLERDTGATLFADNFAIRSAAGSPHVDREAVTEWYDHKHSVCNRDHALLTALKSVARPLRGRPGLIEWEWLPIAAVDSLEIDPAALVPAGRIAEVSAGNAEQSTPAADGLGSTLKRLRRQKEADELELLKACMRATEAGHARARQVVRPGMSEMDVFREVQDAVLESADRPVLIYGDFRAVNAKSPKAGGLPTAARLQEGDLFILDYSVVIDGYRSDFTNTIAVGPPTGEQQMLFALCRGAMQQGEAALVAGRPAGEVYRAVSQALEEAGYGALGHHAGHGIGLSHPEPPILVPESDDTLLAGDVVTLEPGLYVPGIGGMRIENNYLVTSSGSEKLSQHVISLT